MNSVTDATCEFGLARTDEGCVRTLASFIPEGYARLQLLNIAVGLLSLGVSAYKYVLSVRNDGAKLQKRAFLIAMYCSMTFLLRGVDPSSYGHYIPRPVCHFLIDSCTAAVYTVFIMTLSFWVSMIQQGLPSPVERLSRLKLCEYVAIGFVWLFKLTTNAMLWTSKGFDVGLLSYELFGSCLVLFSISTAFVFYGIQVMRRLEQIDTMQCRRMSLESQFETLQTGRVEKMLTSYSTGATSTSSGDCDFASTQQTSSLGMSMPPPPKDHTAILGQPLQPPQKKKKPARKIKEMLIITEVVSIACMAAQIYTGIQRKMGNTALLCANGFHCDKLVARWPILHALQYVAIWCIIFSVRKTTKNRNAATTQLQLPRPMQLA